MANVPEVDAENVGEINHLITILGLCLQPYMQANPHRVHEALRNVAIACASIAGDQSGRLDALYSAPMGAEFYHEALLMNFDEGYKDAHLAMNQHIADQLKVKQ